MKQLGLYNYVQYSRTGSLTTGYKEIEPEFQKDQLALGRMWGVLTERYKVAKQFPEGVIVLPRRARYNHRDKWVYGEIVDFYTRHNNGEITGIYRVTLAEDWGFHHDVAIEDIEFLDREMYPPFDVGDTVTLWRNQGEREGRVVSVHEDIALVFYTMPNGRTFHNICSRYNPDFYKTGHIVDELRENIDLYTNPLYEWYFEGVAGDDANAQHHFTPEEIHEIEKERVVCEY